MYVSILVATFNRDKMLRQVLENLSKVTYSFGNFEVIISDNNSSDDTESVVSKFSERLKIKYLFVAEQGKNFALNEAVGVASGDLFIFIDDDILVEPDFLDRWYQALQRWPKYSVFGGAILPCWPSPVPEEFKESHIFDSAFGVLDLNQAEGPFSEGRPWGGNLGIRSKVLPERNPFNVNVGPSVGAYIMGSESDLLIRLEHSGFTPIYLPDIQVQHIIRPEQLKWRWMLGRAFRRGRGLGRITDYTDMKRLFNCPVYLINLLMRYTLRVLLSIHSRQKLFVSLVYVFECLGRLSYARKT